MNNEIERTPRTKTVSIEAFDNAGNYVWHATSDERIAVIEAAPYLMAYAECEEAYRVSLLPSNKGGSGNSQSYLTIFWKYGYNSKGSSETVHQFLDRLRRLAIAKAEGKC